MVKYMSQHVRVIKQLMVLVCAVSLAPLGDTCAQSYLSPPGVHDLQPPSNSSARRIYWGEVAGLPLSADMLARAQALPARLREILGRMGALKEAVLHDGERRKGEDVLSQGVADALVIPYPVRYEQVAAAADQTQEKAEKKIAVQGRKAVLVVGADGYIGRRHLAALPGALSCFDGDIRILGGCDLNDPSEQTTEMFEAENPGVSLPPFFKSIGDALSYAQKKVGCGPSDIIAVIATPNHIHRDNVQELTQAGVGGLIIEKPLADTIPEAEEICAIGKEADAKIVGAGQTFNSRVVTAIRELMQERGFEPADFLLYWRKDRSERSHSGENMKDPVIFTFDLFHQLGIASMFSPVTAIEHAFTRDMELPEYGEVFKDHGLGVAYAEHEGGVRSICCINFTERGLFHPNEKTINIVGKDGSVIVADLSGDGNTAETLVYVNPDGVIEEVRRIPETAETMLRDGLVGFIRDVLDEEPDDTRPTSLAFQLRMLELIRDAAALTGAHAVPSPPVGTQESL